MQCNPLQTYAEVVQPGSISKKLLFFFMQHRPLLVFGVFGDFAWRERFLVRERDYFWYLNFFLFFFFLMQYRPLLVFGVFGDFAWRERFLVRETIFGEASVNLFIWRL